MKTSRHSGTSKRVSPPTRRRASSSAACLIASTFLFVVATVLQSRSNNAEQDSTKLVLRRAKENLDGSLDGKNLAKPRVAAFGSSMTWGAGLEDRYDAYPYLVSRDVNNYAMFSGGPNYPAVCTQSIIGDDKMYDVILLEYWLKARQGLEALANRLRQRFPNALILFVKLWGPIHARRLPSETSSIKEEITFEQWRDSKFKKIYPQVNSVLNELRADDGYWYFPKHEEPDLMMGSLCQSIGGYNVRIPKKDTAKETVEFYLPFFNRDGAQLSTQGHEFLANLTLATIKVKLENQTTEDLVANSYHGHWGGGDSCKLWYTTGGFGGQHHPSWKMNKFDSAHGKFALEVRGPGWFTVNNEFEEDRTLYLSFLATQPGNYPVTTATIGEAGQPVNLNPHNPLATNNAHNPRTIPIGKIPPGESKIYLTPHKGTGSLFFRLVGYALPTQLASPNEFNFGPSSNNQ